MTAKTTRLTRAVKIYLDIGWWVFAAMAFGLVPLAGLLIVVVGVQEPAGDRPALPVLVGIRVNDAQLVPIESGSAEEYSALEGGQGQLRIRTGSRLGWAAVLGLAELMFLVDFGSCFVRSSRADHSLRKTRAESAAWGWSSSVGACSDR
jgi:hypothetical protein